MPDEDGKLSVKEWGEVFDYFIKKLVSKTEELDKKIVSKPNEYPFYLHFDENNELTMIIDVDKISIYNSFTNLLDDLDEGLVDNYSTILIYSPRLDEFAELFRDGELHSFQYSGLSIIGCPFYSERKNNSSCYVTDCNSHLYVKGCRCVIIDELLKSLLP